MRVQVRLSPLRLKVGVYFLTCHKTCQEKIKPNVIPNLIPKMGSHVSPDAIEVESITSIIWVIIQPVIIMMVTF